MKPYFIYVCYRNYLAENIAAMMDAGAKRIETILGTDGVYTIRGWHEKNRVVNGEGI